MNTHGIKTQPWLVPALLLALGLGLVACGDKAAETPGEASSGAEAPEEAPTVAEAPDPKGKYRIEYYEISKK